MQTTNINLMQEVNNLKHQLSMYTLPTRFNSQAANLDAMKSTTTSLINNNNNGTSKSNNNDVSNIYKSLGLSGVGASGYGGYDTARTMSQSGLLTLKSTRY